MASTPLHVLILLVAAERFALSEWKKATVNVDYHVALFDHFYSVPYTLVREEVEARLTATTVGLNGPKLGKATPKTLATSDDCEGLFAFAANQANRSPEKTSAVR